MSRELLQRAIDALENGRRVRECEGGTQYQPMLEEGVMAELRAALAAPAAPAAGMSALEHAAGMALVALEETAKHAGPGYPKQKVLSAIAELLATLPAPCAPPVAPAEECTCDTRGIGVPGVSCGDCPRDYVQAAPTLAEQLECEADWVEVAPQAGNVGWLHRRLKLTAELLRTAAQAVGDKAAPGEPVAWMRKGAGPDCTVMHNVYFSPPDPASAWNWTPLYTHAIPPDVQRDAERYRWLRNSATWKQATTTLNDTPAGIDAAIDAAMTAPKVTP